MNSGMKLTALLGIGLALWVIDVPGDGLPVRAANAIVGAPLTPMSAAGVARRTTRRVVGTEVAVASTEASYAAAASAAAASAPHPPAPAPAPAALPVGTIVSALPPNCEQATVGGVAYSYCGGVYYRAGFQGNNVVYIVSRP